MESFAVRVSQLGGSVRQGVCAGLLSLGICSPVHSGEPPAEAIPPASLAELARAADVVALVQVRDTDYLRRREIPVSGSAYLAVLIAYKSGQPGELLEVYERGLHEQECYFANPSVFEEGRRYLVFLRRDPEDEGRYRGLPQGCAIDVLVDRDNRYGVRMPVSGLELTQAQQDSLRALARPLDFGDPYALVEDEALSSAQRDAMRAAGQIAPYPPQGRPERDAAADAAAPLPPSSPPPRRWKYVRGIPLEQFSELLALEPDL